MIPKEEWTTIVEHTIQDMIEDDHWVVRGWDPCEFVMRQNTIPTREMRYTQLIPCPYCPNRLVGMRRWVYFHGWADIMFDHTKNGDRERMLFVRWRQEPFGFLFGKCSVCNVVPFIFFPSEQATFFYMTQIGRESCIEL